MILTTNTKIGELIPRGRYCGLFTEPYLTQNGVKRSLSPCCVFLKQSSCGYHCAIIDTDCHMGKDEMGVLKHNDPPYNCFEELMEEKE